ncbi:hypothetical protein MMC07_006599 [Pseudocyphellaria aurata]|nr:hypothetical protein [Pseudocyphellaria aurata]
MANISSPSLNTDSPLSITSSVLSILTFTLGLFGFYLALISATRSAPGEIQRSVSELRSTQAEINRVSQWIFEEDDDGRGGTWVGAGQGRFGWERAGATSVVEVNHGGGEKTGQKVRRSKWASGNTRTELRPVTPDISGNQMLYEEVQALLVTCVRLFYEADDLLKRSQREGPGLWRRVLFVMNRDEVLDKVSRLQEQKARLAAIQMSLFLRKSTAHHAMLRRIVNFIDDFEAHQKRAE